MFRKPLFPESQDFMIRLNCDYCKGALPEVLEALQTINDQAFCGYGCDEVCERAARLIRERAGAPSADVHFLVGGTQANFIVIESALRPWQSVICADSGHINVHETGAVEATGHKVLPLPSTPDGKITAEQVENAYLAHVNDASFEHMVQPKLVYISLPTENGGLYSKAELTALHDVCTRCGLYLFMDGARLGYGLTAPENDVALADLCALSDVFYIGGTKVGALFGEAVVITNPALKTDFRYHIKQRGGMLAKGRLLGVQFEAMLENGDYTRLAARANDLAQELKRAFVDHGCALFSDTAANQIFPILPDEAARRLATGYAFSFWERVDDTHQAVRFCTNVTTDRADVDALLRDIDRAF